MALYTAMCKKYEYTDDDWNMTGDDGEAVMKKRAVVEAEDPAVRAKREKAAKEAMDATDALKKQMENGRKMDEDERLTAQIDAIKVKAGGYKNDEFCI